MKFYFSIFLFLYTFFVDIKAQEITLDLPAQRKFADELYQIREFYRAITEYQRILYFFPQAEKTSIYIKILQTYLAGEDYDSAIKLVENLKEKEPNIYQDTQIQYLYALALLDKDSRRIFYYREADIKKALNLLENIPLKNTQSFAKEWQKQEFSKKSPWLSGILSGILPGAGSVYVSRYKEAFYSFFITGLFIGSALESRQNENFTQEAFFSFFALAFYGGNIYTSVNSAYKYNEYEKSNRFENLRLQYNIQFQF